MRNLFKRPLLLFAVGFTLLVAGCGGDDDSSGDDAAAGGTEAASTSPGDEPARESGGGDRGGDGSQAAGPSEPPGLEIKVAESEFGPILFDEDDRAIYLFDAEQTDRPECYGECAAAWPPVLSDGAPQAGDGAEAGLLGTTERDDGSTQVTYDGHPLYYYVDDPPGQVLCHNVVEFGGLWLVVSPDGDAVQ
jgi:predicted lipoprotein with Yx(FWY)xxD motif